MSLGVAVSFACASVSANAEGWRFWKRKKSADKADTEQTTKEPVVDRANMDRSEVEKSIRDAQKAQARAEKKRQDEMAKALRKKKREMARQQRDMERAQKKRQREQQRRLDDLSRKYQGKRSWQFWRRSDKSTSDFFLPRSQ